MKDFALPDLGEGLTESEIVEWHVAVGDRVTLNQPLADVETAKAIVQLPSPFEGVIGALYAEPGATVRVGAPIVGFESAAQPVADRAQPSADPAQPSADPIPSRSVERNPVLVGYGAPVDTGARPQRKRRVDHPVFVPARGAALSTPPVRKLAHDLGVDLSQLHGSGEGGAVTREDVVAAGSGTTSGDRRIPVRGVRKATAAAMVSSAFTAPHVTEFLTVDVTRSAELVARLRDAGQRASLLAVVAKALCLAVRRNPTLNSRWEESEIVEFDAVHLGIAVATPRGLMVPVIRDAHTLALTELTDAIAALAAMARAGEATPAALTGGTISISNVGVFGVDAGTPILNPGESGILAIGAVRRRPWEHRGKLKLRDVMTLSLSFDHRVVDGEQGSRFLAEVGAMLEEPGLVLARI